MPGFSRNQFVDLTNVEEEDLLCGICLEIFSDPVVVQCCQRAFCRDCIKHWMEIHNTCPNDRKLLMESSFIEPPKSLMSLINKLEIRCNFFLEGCDQIMRFDGLKAHVKKCLFNPHRECSDCGLTFKEKDSHNCVSNLKAVNVSLKRVVKELMDKIKNMEEEDPDKVSNNLDCAENAIVSARLYINNGNEPIIKDCIASDIKICKAIELSIEAIRFHDTFLDISHHIYNELSRKSIHEQKEWHVITHAKSCGESRVCFINTYIDLLFDELRIQIFDTGNRWRQVK